MQQQPPKGRLFPDRPVEQTNAPRFSNNNTQGYEAQPRMQQTGSYGMSQSSRYGTGSFQAVRDSQPVNTMPPMAAMPTAQAYSAQQALSNSQRFSTGSFQPVRDSQPVNTMPPVTTVASPMQPVVQQGAPVMMQTVQGTPVLISPEQLQAVVAQLTAQGLLKPSEEQGSEKTRADRKADKKAEKKSRKEKKMKVIARPSLFWVIFGIIGFGFSAWWIWNWVIVPALAWIAMLQGGAA